MYLALRNFRLRHINIPKLCQHFNDRIELTIRCSIYLLITRSVLKTGCLGKIVREKLSAGIARDVKLTSNS